MMVHPGSHGVSRAPWYSGTCPQSPTGFRLRGSHPLCQAFPDLSAIHRICNSAPHLQVWPTGPTTPVQQRLQSYIAPVWALPLSLAATRGVSVDLLSSRYLDVSVPWVRSACAVTPHDGCWVSPFGYPRVIACLPARRGLSQAPTPFIAF